MGPLEGQGVSYGAVSDTSLIIEENVEELFEALGDKTLHALEDVTEEVDMLVKRAFVFSDVPALAIPWFLFTTCLLPLALMREVFLSQLAFALSLVLSAGFLMLSRGRAWQMLAVTCFAATALGEAMGSYDRYKYFYEYYIYTRSPAYSDVLPTENPGGFKDAGYLKFSADAHVQTITSAGYASDQRWCVAPIVSSFEQESIGFWAVGIDCCGLRGGFACGPVLNKTSHGGLVLLDASPVTDAEIPTFKKAAEMAAETFGMTVPDDAIFIRWGVTTTRYLEDVWSSAVSFCIMALVMFAALVFSFTFLLRVTNLPLTAMGKKHSTWHPQTVDKMTFGFETTPRAYGRDFQVDLLNHRCYWSGEVMLDYAFHVANKHLFLGIFFCHPVHPYSKWERAVVALIVSLLIVFPIALIFTLNGESPPVIVVLLLVTLPRNLVKIKLLSVTSADSAIELSEHGGTSRKATNALYFEFAFLGACVVGAVLVALLCCSLIQASIQGTSKTLVGQLCMNSDGLGFAAIVELLLDIVLPFFSPGHGHVPAQMTIGFFGRWCLERDELEASLHIGSKPRRGRAGMDSKKRRVEDGSMTIMDVLNP